MNKDNLDKIAISKQVIGGALCRKGALGMREAKREKRQSRAVLTAIWGLLDQLAVKQRLLQGDLIDRLEPQAKRTLSRAICDLCSALKRVSVSAMRWATYQRLPHWDWDRAKRAVRLLDQRTSQSQNSGQELGQKIRDDLDNAPRSYAEAIEKAQTTNQILQTVKSAEKAQRAQLTRLFTELQRDRIARSPIQSNLHSLKRTKYGALLEESDRGPRSDLIERLETEIERAKIALGNFTLKIMQHLAGEKIEPAKMGSLLSRRNNDPFPMGKPRRGRPPLKHRLAVNFSTALDQAQHKWEMAYLEVKKLLKASLPKSR